MYQIDSSTAITVQPTPTAAGTAGFFSDGNAATGAAPTIVPAEFLNMLMMEMLGVLSAAGITPSKTSFTQLAASIRSINRQAVILADTGTANAYAAANVPALTVLPATGYLQRVSIATLNTTTSTYAPDGLAPRPIYGKGLQALQGGELPVGIATFMYLVQAGVNSGNGAWILLESLGGAVQVAAASKSQHAVQLAQMAAVVGGIRNGKMSISAASATATFTADELAVKTALGGPAWLLSSFSKSINLATTGAGGMDTGTAPVSGFVGIYAIYNPATGMSALLGVNATSSILPNVYGGANMPVGYTASALISVWPTGSGSLLRVGYQRDRKIWLGSTQVLSGTSLPSTLSPISISSAVPQNAISVSGLMSLQATTGTGGLSISVYSDSAGSAQQGINGYSTTTAGIIAGFNDLVLSTIQLIYFGGQANGPTAYSDVVNINGYSI